MKAWQSFREGFVGSFVLAGSIVLAVVGVASSFVNTSVDSQRRQDDATQF